MTPATLLLIGGGLWLASRPAAPVGLGVAPLPPAPVPYLDPPVAPTGLLTTPPPWLLEHRYGRPLPTNAWDHDVIPAMAPGEAQLSLTQFPVDDLPSGGESHRISPSEMCIVYAKVGSYDHQIEIGSVTQTWTRDGEVLFSYTMQTDPAWWWAWMYSFIGRFWWEIDRPGLYQCRVSCNLGDAVWQFRVVNGAGAGAHSAGACVAPLARPLHFSMGRGAAAYGGGGKPPLARSVRAGR